MIAVPSPNFSHLLAMTGPFGTFEHADHDVARVEHGYCTDDVARVLLVVVREPLVTGALLRLAESSMEFLRLAQAPSGEFTNRRLVSGAWWGEPSTEDCWGRAMWALGTTIALAPSPGLVSEAHQLFERGAKTRSSWPRSMAWAVIGAVEVLHVEPGNRGAHDLLMAGLNVLDRGEVSRDWQWPEGRLTYANAALAEAVIAAGSWLGDGRLLRMGLRQLHWLLAMETRSGHLSVTPVGGRGPRDPLRLFDQQPIEVAAIAEACVRAYDVAGDRQWLTGLDRAVAWFMGDNDADAVMFDMTSGGGYDGLTPHGPNLNQGTESTVALLSTLQHARRFALSFT